MLEKVRYRDHYRGIDVQAFTDGYGYDEYSGLYLLSVAGHDGSVRAISSALVSGRTVEIMSKPVIQAWAPFGEKYRILSGKLASGLLHQLVVGDGFFTSADAREKLLYVDRSEDAARLVYEAVRSGHPVPLIPEWAEWLYDRLLREGRVEELLGTKKVLRVRLDEELLDSLVSEGVRNDEITF